MTKCITVSLFILALLLSAGPATAKTFYLSDGSTIEYRKVWKKGDRIFLLVNRDTLVEFLPEEVDQVRTLKAAGLKKFPSPHLKKNKSVSAPAKRAKAAPAPSPATKPAGAEEQPFSFNDAHQNVSVTSVPGPADKGSDVPAEATVNGKYSELVQIMYCLNDQGAYGKFRDYGWWGGGPWCGQTGKAGYWVWVAPNWYVWSGKN